MKKVNHPGNPNRPKISIVTPSFNQARFLEKTILSVINQNYPNLEYIVMDGGSQDGSVEILNKYQNAISYWTSEPDDGQADAINRGFNRAGGEIIAWINSDDVYIPGSFKKVADIFVADPEIDIIYGDYAIIDVNDKLVKRIIPGAFVKSKLIKSCFIGQQATFFRKTSINKYGPLDTALNFVLDYDFWLKIMYGGGRFYYLNQCLAKHRLWYDCKSQGSSIAMAFEKYALQEKYLRQYPEDSADFREGLCNTSVWIAGLGISENKPEYTSKYLHRIVEISGEWFEDNIENIVNTIARTIYQKHGRNALRIANELVGKDTNLLIRKLNRHILYVLINTLIREKRLTPAVLLQIILYKPFMLIMLLKCVFQHLIKKIEFRTATDENT